MEELLRAQWRAAVPAAAGDISVAGSALDDAITDLLARYREPQRRYHTVTHLAAVLTTAEGLLAQVAVDDPAAVRLALFFHDAVYDPRSTTNEVDSADLSRRVLSALGVARAACDAVAALVIATAGHEPPGGIDPGAASVVLDADLAILAAEPAAYSAYVAGVRAEYSHIDDAGWRAGRAAVLAELLRRSEIYRSPPMRGREARARANLTAELATLRSA